MSEQQTGTPSIKAWYECDVEYEHHYICRKALWWDCGWFTNTDADENAIELGHILQFRGPFNLGDKAWTKTS